MLLDDVAIRGRLYLPWRLLTMDCSSCACFLRFVCVCVCVCASGAFAAVSFSFPAWLPVRWELERRAAENKYATLRGEIN